MSDQQKIWFIYLTDHHEGPFTAQEIAEKARAGLVTGQSLAWKDGMPEWVPAESIPELNAAMGGGGPAVAENTASIAAIAEEAAPVAEGGGEEGPSLAQLLAQSQSSSAGSIPASAPISSAPAAAVAEPGPSEDAWTLKVGAHVSGLHSMNKLKNLAGNGEVPADAMLWHPGWTDFQPVSAIAQLDSARRSAPAKADRTKANITRPGMTVSASGPVYDDEPTDTGITVAPKGFRGLLARISSLTKKKKVAAAAKAGPGGAAGKRAAAKRSGGGGGAIKRIVFALFLIAVLGGGGAAYFLFFLSPIPTDLDVLESDHETMAEAAKHPKQEGVRFAFAASIGTPDNPPDATSPKYYVATNLPEGSTVSLTVTGVPGTLVNRVSFEKTFTATVAKKHLAVFDQINDDGKPLWGEFTMKVTAEGADPLDAGKKFIGNKGGPYQNRLKIYKESVLGEHDKEITELREYISTLKNLQAEVSKQLAEYKVHGANVAMRTKLTGEWSVLARSFQLMLNQLTTRLKERQAGDKQAKYHGRAFQDVATTVGQLEQLIKAHSDRLAGTPPTANADELDGLVQAGVQALESWLAMAVTKNPFDHTATPGVAPAAAPASAQAPVPVAPAPVAAPVAPPVAPAAVAPAPVPGAK